MTDLNIDVIERTASDPTAPALQRNLAIEILKMRNEIREVESLQREVEGLRRELEGRNQ